MKFDAGFAEDGDVMHVFEWKEVVLVLEEDHTFVRDLGVNSGASLDVFGLLHILRHEFVVGVFLHSWFEFVPGRAKTK